MKKTCILLAAVLLLSLGASAWADDGVSIEVVTLDGVSVVIMTTADSLAPYSVRSGYTLPQMLMQIGEEAFAGVPAKRIEVSENVNSIGRRAFADCTNLRELVIPSGVVSIDEHALDGCENVLVYGAAGSAAELFVQAAKAAHPDAGFAFVDLDRVMAVHPILTDSLPVVLPFVPAA